MLPAYNMYFINQDEKYNAAAYCQQLEGERPRAKTEVLEEDSTPDSVSSCLLTHPVYSYLEL